MMTMAVSLAVIDEFGNREEQSWDPAARTGTITDGRGNVTTLVYDDRGNVLEVNDPLGEPDHVPL